MQITNGRAADPIFNAIAGTFLNDLAIAAAMEATILVYGALDSKTFSLDGIFEAYRYLESNQAQGKIIIKV